jgi:hypothetical protein
VNRGRKEEEDLFKAMEGGGLLWVLVFAGGGKIIGERLEGGGVEEKGEEDVKEGAKVGKEGKGGVGLGRVTCFYFWCTHVRFVTGRSISFGAIFVRWGLIGQRRL